MWRNFFPYVRVSAKLVAQLNRQRNYLKKYLEPHLAAAQKSNDGSLEAADFAKIRNYYALFVVAIVGENYCTLRGSKMTERERKVLTFQGALTGLYDDFFDHPKRKNARVMEMMDNPFSYAAENSVDRLFLFFLQQVHQNLEDKKDFDAMFLHIYKVQIETEKQINSNLSAQELKKISSDKGGLSHLFYRITLSNPLGQKEHDCIYELGSLLQQVNDIFDVWKDSMNGISTFATASKDMRQTKQEFENQLQKVYEMVLALDYDNKNKRNFFLQLMILIGMGIVSLNQYIGLQEGAHKEFNPHDFTRHQLVCDMQRKSNLAKLMKVCLSFDFRFKKIRQ
ncbi:MAG: hypothetical protein IPP32_17530 [Bacteroidetes bacterium]|nr:hypothetical protein [Bacteroidota bacterium]